MKTQFNEKHCVGEVIAKSGCFSRFRRKPENIDLRYLRMIELSDTFDGRGRCVDGIYHRAILYGNKVVWESSSHYIDGSRQISRHRGNDLFLLMYHVSNAWLHIQAIARRKYFQEKISGEADPHNVHIMEDVMKVLITHPQYTDMVKIFGLTLTETKQPRQYRVDVSKYHSDEDEDKEVA